jgi:hypothetical protein
MLRKGIGSCLIGQVFKKWSQKMCNSVNLWSKKGPSSASYTYSTAHNQHQPHAIALDWLQVTFCYSESSSVQ